MFPQLAYPIVGLQILLLLAGLVLLWRVVISKRAQPATVALPRWNSEAVEIILLLLFVMLGTFAGSVVASYIVKLAQLKGDPATLVGGSGAQFGMLAGALAFATRSAGYRQHAPNSWGRIVRDGAVTFVIALPILDSISKVWELLLRSVGIPAEQQDLIRIFAEAKSPVFLVGLIVLATVIAPLGEELVFRAGLFRFFRAHLPRWMAILVPAVIFAALHVSWTSHNMEGLASFAPLVALAVLFSIAYERTGHIGTTIVAHALFNLNTILLILTGLATT